MTAGAISFIIFLLIQITPLTFEGRERQPGDVDGIWGASTEKVHPPGEKRT